MAVDAFVIEAPRVVVRFGSVSYKSRELVESIISCFISVSNPRDMLPAFCNVSLRYWCYLVFTNYNLIK